MNLLKKIRLTVLSWLFRKTFRLQTRDINYHSLSKKRATNLEYETKKFKDTLFNVDSQKRENSSILKLLKSPHLFFLCNSTYAWVAVNIPLNLCGGDIEGDIDILIAMVCFPETKKIYRTFEVKTTKINKNKIIKSLKAKKFKKTKKQLIKNIDAGAQQSFLLNIFILEADYSLKFNQLPSSVISFISEKVSEIKREEFGYICIFLEQQRDFDEERVSVQHLPMSLKGAKIKKLKSPMKEIVKKIEDYLEKEQKERKEPIFVAYCKKCKKLNTLQIQTSLYKCKYCGKNIFHN